MGFRGSRFEGLGCMLVSVEELGTQIVFGVRAFGAEGLNGPGLRRLA